MESLPLVSVVCLCYNQKEFAKSALESAITQTYPNIEIIVVDDASTDGSRKEIESFLQDHPDIKFIPLSKNLGNCAAFNLAFARTEGKYIIDLAADDLLLPVRVEMGVADLEMADKTYGVHFSDAFIIDKEGKILNTHFVRNQDGDLIEDIPQGDIYRELITRYFINPPTMMMKREVLEALGGYDETLSYEDFDFWIRSSRKYKYLFNKTPLVKKRVLKKSLSSNQFTFRNKHQTSTQEVCQKILSLNQTKAENQALISRCWYEIRQCLKTLNLQLIPGYLKLIREVKSQISF